MGKVLIILGLMLLIALATFAWISMRAISPSASVSIPGSGTGADAQISDNGSTRPLMKLVIAARIDGSDFLTIDQHKATWEHGNWGVPTDVSINGINWDLNQSTEMINGGDTTFLPYEADFKTARVVSRSGRDVVAVERIDEGLMVVFADTAAGADNYNVTIEVRAAEKK